MSYEIEFYVKSNGRIPIEEFLLELKKKNWNLYLRTYQDMMLLKEYGRDIPEKHSKGMGDGLFELRSKAESGISRVFYFFFTCDKIILTNGFVKKTQKTPPGELEKAHRYKKDYEENHD